MNSWKMVVIELHCIISEWLNWYALLHFLSSFAIILTRKRELLSLLSLFFRCRVTVNILWFSLNMPWVGLQCVIVVFPYHTHLLFCDIWVDLG